MSANLLVCLTFGVGCLVGLPIAWILLISGFLGILALRGFDVALGALAIAPYARATDFNLVAIPLFILMGAFAVRGGMSEQAYAVAYRFIGHLRGGLGMATVFACATFAATSGSSVATSAAVGRFALAEMKRFRYNDAVSAGTVAASGLLGMMIPPSIMMIVYGVITRTDIGKLFIAGILPGILTAIVFCIGLYALARLRPDLMPAAHERTPWAERMKSLGQAWEILLLLFIIIGGIYGGIFTATEAGAVSAVTAFLLMIRRRGLHLGAILQSAREATETCAMIFLILIGATLFGQYVALSGVAAALSQYVTAVDLSPMVILWLILLVYVPLGMFLEPISMALITLPIVFPTVMSLGFDPIWFGILVVKMSELGSITPPLGLSVFVIKSIRPEMSLNAVFKGSGLFVVLELITLAILVNFPMVSLFLPSLMR